jgi:hypothetical protein
VDDNPVFIVAIYESLLNPREQLVLGARAEARPTTGLRLGGQVISEEREGGNYGLVEGDVRWSPSRQLTLDGELARSQVAGRDGSAWRLSATFAPNSRGQARAYFKQIDPEFENATTSSFELGMRQYGLMGGYRFGRDATLGLDYYHSEDRRLGNTVDSLSAGWRQRFGRTIGDLRFEHQQVEQADTGTSDQYSILTARLRTPLSRRVGLYVARDQNLSGDSSPIRPSATTVGADYLLDERNAAYLRYKRAEDPVRDVVLLGLESRFGEYGSAYTQYQIGGAINGERTRPSSGWATVADRSLPAGGRRLRAGAPRRRRRGRQRPHLLVNLLGVPAEPAVPRLAQVRNAGLRHRTAEHLVGGRRRQGQPRLEPAGQVPELRQRELPDGGGRVPFGPLCSPAFERHAV